MVSWFRDRIWTPKFERYMTSSVSFVHTLTSPSPLEHTPVRANYVLAFANGNYIVVQENAVLVGEVSEINPYSIFSHACLHQL
jgi:hypothetical protein